MTPEHLLLLYQQGKRDFMWADLRNVSLQRQSLVGANFNRAKLQNVDLSGADLSGCSFLKADLSGADLTAACLKGAHFRKANLSDATLDIEQLPISALQGATLPNGTVIPVQPAASQPDAMANAVPAPDSGIAAVEPDILPSPSLSPQTTTDEPERWAKGIDVQAEVAKRPPPPPPFQPRTRAEVIAAIPQIPVGFFIGGYLINGLILYLAAASGTAWIISAISTQLWAIHSGLTWFIPIVVALAALLGGPIAGVPLLVLPTVTFLMMMGGFLVVGWHWRTALHGALWFAGVSAVLFCMTPWLVAPTGAFTAVIAPTALLAALLVVAVGSISIGLTSIEAMDIAHIHARHQRLVTGLGGSGGLLVGGILGWLMSLLA